MSKLHSLGLTTSIWKSLTFIYDSLREDCGRPVSLYSLIESMPELRSVLVEPEKTISTTNSVVRWHEWGTTPISYWPHRARGELMGWRNDVGHYRSFITYRDEFANFGSCFTEDCEVDIQAVTGLSSSKSSLSDFSSLDEMVKTNSREMIDSISEEKLRKNLAHNEIRILKPGNTDDFLARFLWDGRFFLINSGGSHHFAAARYIASRLNVMVPIQSKLRTYGINQSAFNSLQCDYDMFVIPYAPEANNGFHKAMVSFRATYLWQFLPKPYEDKKAIFFQRAKPARQKWRKCCGRQDFSILENTYPSLSCGRQESTPKTLPNRFLSNRGFFSRPRKYLNACS